MTEESKILRDVAQENGLHEKQTTLIARSIFGFVAEVIESGSRKPVRIPKCGLFSCRSNRVKHLKEKNLL